MPTGSGERGDLLDARRPSPRSASASSVSRSMKAALAALALHVGDVEGILGENRGRVRRGSPRPWRGAPCSSRRSVASASRRAAARAARPIAAISAASGRLRFSGLVRRGSWTIASYGNIGERRVFAQPLSVAHGGRGSPCERRPNCPGWTWRSARAMNGAPPERRIPMNRPIPDGARTSRPQNIAAGIGLMLLAVFLFSMNDALGKWLAETLCGAADPPLPEHLGARHPARPSSAAPASQSLSACRARGCRCSAPCSPRSRPALFYAAVAVPAARRRHDLLPRRTDLRDGARGAVPRREGRVAAVERGRSSASPACSSHFSRPARIFGWPADRASPAASSTRSS